MERLTSLYRAGVTYAVICASPWICAAASFTTISSSACKHRLKGIAVREGGMSGQRAYRPAHVFWRPHAASKRQTIARYGNAPPGSTVDYHQLIGGMINLCRIMRSLMGPVRGWPRYLLSKRSAFAIQYSTSSKIATPNAASCVRTSASSCSLAARY